MIIPFHQANLVYHVFPWNAMERMIIMKLPNGFGSVYKLSGNRRNPWCARKTVGWTFDEEKQKSYPVYVFIGYYPNRKDALIALSDYNKDPYEINNLTFAEVYEKWSEIHYPKISESNVKGYKSSFKTCSDLHNIRFSDLKFDQIQKVMDDSGKNSPMLKKIKVMIGMMYDYDVLHDIVSQEKRDKIRYLDISKTGNPNKRTRKPFTKKEINKLWITKENPYISIILILIYTGLRIGELLDLEKKDVHLEERWFFVKEAKTEAGIREVPIAEKIVPFFEYWLNRESDYLVCTPEGNQFLYGNYYDSYWKPFTDHKPHDTRHTCVSLLTEAGVDERVIRQIVGHKGQGVTETVYTHLELPIKLEAINKI